MKNNSPAIRRSPSRPRAKLTPLSQRLGEKQTIPVKAKPPARKSGIKSQLTALGAIATLLGATALIVGGVWIGFLLIINPDASIWVNRFFPKLARTSGTAQNHPQTLTQIQTEIRKRQLKPGDPLFLNSHLGGTDLLLPIFKSDSTCQTPCDQIIELRIYQPVEANGSEVETHYRLATQVAVSGPDESSVLAPLDDSESSISSRSLPLTEVKGFDKAPTSGVWLNLSGELKQGGTSLLYGHLVHYNPSTAHLSLMVSWTSPAGQAPYWQEVTGGEMPELVVNQTVGLDPQFRVYQIKPRDFSPDPIDLEEITLTEPALDNQAYRKALTLARGGLWSTAWEWLQALSKTGLPSNAQAQKDLIYLHAQVTQSQAKRLWASPSQQVLAALIDGRWKDALQVFESSDDENRNEIAMGIKADSGRLWKRVEAALKVNATQNEVKAWGALMQAVQQGQPQAIAWLQKQQKNTPQTLTQIEEVLAELDLAMSEKELGATHLSQLMGSVTPLSQVNVADWLQPDVTLTSGTPPLQLEEQQVWYQVQISAFNDGKGWVQAPFTNLKQPLVAPGKQLWRKLGLNTDPRILITTWQPNGEAQRTLATAKAVQLKNGVLQLLVAGEVLPATGETSTPLQPLASTEAAFQLLQPESITLSELNEQQPQWGSVILPTLWHELQAAGYVPQGAIPNVSVMLNSVGNWPIKAVDLTGNNQPEAVLTVDQEFAATLKASKVNPSIGNGNKFKPHTLIFSDTGALVYSEFTTEAKQSLMAIADLGSGKTALIVNNLNTYSLKRWSPQRQRFE